MMSVVWTALLVIAFFGVMIFLHELGHYIVARLCHVTILEFSLGMGPKLFGSTSKKTGTLYALRLLPIGGYCSMLGENDEETTDEGALCKKPAWQRFCVLFAGSFMNLVSAFLAMCLVLSLTGSSVTSRVSGFYIPSYAGGLEIGDVITAVNGTPVETEAQLQEAIAALGNELCTFTVLRGEEELTLSEIGLPQKEEDGKFVRVLDFVTGGDGALETQVTRYTAPSAEAGLQSGDTILRVNGHKIQVYTDISWEIGLAGDSPCTLTVSRTAEDGTEQILEITDVVFPVTSEDGVLLGTPDFGLESEPLGGFFDTLQKAFWECVSTVKIVYQSLLQMIAGRFGTAGISGPIGVAETISEYAAYGFAPLLQLFVIISLNLGICNLLPLPALDGGRLIFVLLEMIRRKPINQKYEAVIHAAGMVILLIFTAFVAVMDITRLIGG